MINACIDKFAICWQRALWFVLAGSVLAGCSPVEKGAAPESTTAAQTQGVPDERTALDKYVAAPDANYGYHPVNTVRGQDQTTYILEMTSQAWLTTNEVDRPLWKHWMILVRPDAVASSKALLLISCGANDGRVPKSAEGNLARIAVATKSVVAELKMVPNQPLVFAGATEGRKEDSLITYTWDKFLRTGDPKWPARLPMTKAAVRALDTIIAFCGSPDGGNVKVDGFVVAGGSKRGWTTWTTAARSLPRYYPSINGRINRRRALVLTTRCALRFLPSGFPVSSIRCQELRRDGSSAFVKRGHLPYTDLSFLLTPPQPFAEIKSGKHRIAEFRHL